MEQRVILVDGQDRETGLEGKLEAHRKGELHRAISVYIFNHKGELMLQKRAAGVYHSGLLWSNTCCTNCYEGETAPESAHRSLKSEMGFDCELQEEFNLIYETPVSNGLIEHEFLHVFFGMHDDDPVLNEGEVMDWKWMRLDALEKDVRSNGDAYTPWLKIILEGNELQKKAREFLDANGK